MIPAMSGGGLRMSTAHREGRPRGLRGAASMLWTGVAARRAVPSLAKGGGGGKGLAGAHERMPGNGGGGKPPMHVRRIRLDVDADTDLKDRGNGAPADLARSRRGPEPRRPACRDAPDALQRRWAAHRTGGRRPAEAAARSGHSGRRPAPARSAAGGADGGTQGGGGGRGAAHGFGPRLAAAGITAALLGRARRRHGAAGPPNRRGTARCAGQDGAEC